MVVFYGKRHCKLPFEGSMLDGHVIQEVGKDTDVFGPNFKALGSVENQLQEVGPSIQAHLDQ